MYRPRYRPSFPLAALALTLATFSLATMPGMFGFPFGQGSYPIPPERGTRGTAAKRREAAKKANKKRQRMTCARKK